MEKVKVDSSFNRAFFGVVTSMCLDDNKLYIGKGNFLLIYDTESDKKINYLQVFNSNKITKIKIFPINENTKIIITIGETQIKYSLFNNNDNQYQFKTIKTMSGDYAVDAMIIQNNNINYCSLGFINNYFELYTFTLNDDKSITLKYIKTFFSPSKCIVYSMAFYHNAQNNTILIASGTVFRQIIIWEVSLDSITQLATNLVLTGHEGVIFSVHFINETKLTSTSDDRTTKVWTIDKEKKTFSQITLFGHSCRVWDSIVNSKKNILVSISEDATGRVYDIEKNEFLFELSNGHLGKNIRSVEINDKYIWTGGEDGQIIKWSLNNQKEKKKEQKKNNILYYSLSNTDEQSQKAKIKQKNFTPCVKVLKFINENTLLIGSNNGKVASYNIKEKKNDIDYFNDYQVRVINSIEVVLNKFILVGLSDGNIQLINMENPKEENITIKVFHNIRVPFISHKIFPESNEMFLFISTALGRTKIYYFENNKEINFDLLNKEGYSSVEISNNVVCLKDSEISLSVTGNIRKGSKGCKCHQKTRCLTFENPKYAKVLPVLNIDECDVEASHSLSSGTIDEEVLFYMNSRGLSQTNALSLLLHSYLMPDDEFYKIFENGEMIKEKAASKVENIC